MTVFAMNSWLRAGNSLVAKVMSSALFPNWAVRAFVVVSFVM